MFSHISSALRRLYIPPAWSILIAALAAGFAAAGNASAASYTLTVENARLAINGRTVEKMTINGGVPGPTLRLTEGEEATITVVNRTDEPTSVHWHGILLPGIMDGAPGFNGFMGIAPGASYTYTFKIRQSGTYWYHSHTGTQDQSVLGAIVIAPKVPPPFRYDRDYVVLLGDAMHENSDQVLRNLKADPGFYNYGKRTLGDFLADAQRDGLGATLADRRAWGEMRMDPTDLADVTGYAFLVNGRTPTENETLIFKKGERIRLRLINGAAMSFFDVRIPGLKMTVAAADGNDVNPVSVDELRIGVAERYDILVEPEEDIAYTLFAESIDRMGDARATLAPRAGMAGPIPQRRPRTLLTMADMGMAHEDMDYGSMGMSGMDHAAMGHDMASSNQAAVEAAMPGMDAKAAADAARPRGWGAGFPPDARVLRYADLNALRRNVDSAEPARTIELRLTGNMERYVWTLNDDRFDAAEPIRVPYGERVRLTFVNETMMAHPMHLHGMFFELENGQRDRKPLKDTVIVPPGQAVSVVLTAREVGGWPLHCHLLYHMASGMMTTFVVEPSGAAESALTPDHAVVPVAVESRGSHAGHGGHAR